MTETTPPTNDHDIVKRSLRISGRVSTVKLERLYWNYLDLQAIELKSDTPDLVRSIHASAHSERIPGSNFASTLRIWCLSDAWPAEARL